MVPRADECRWRRVRITPSTGRNGSTTTTGFTNRNSRTGGWQAPTIGTGNADAEDCEYSCEQEAAEARERYYTGRSSEERFRREVCDAGAWQTGHECSE